MITVTYKGVEFLITEQLCPSTKFNGKIEDIEDVNVEDVKEYINYLTLRSFTISNGFLKLLEMFSNIRNEQQHPLDFYTIKLREDFIRKNFYKLGLYNDPYFGLNKLESKLINFSIQNREMLDAVLNLVGDGKSGCIIAGGSLIHKLTKDSDIDVFLYNKTEEEANEIIKKLSKKDAIVQLQHPELNVLVDYELDFINWNKTL